MLTLQCGYFFAKRMATWEAIKPAPPVINTFFGSYGISLTLFFVAMFLPSPCFMGFFLELFFLFVAKKSRIGFAKKTHPLVQITKKESSPLYFKNTFCAPRRANCIIDYSFLVFNKEHNHHPQSLFLLLLLLGLKLVSYLSIKRQQTNRRNLV